MVGAMQNEESSPYHPRARVDLGQGPGRNPWRDRTGRVRAHPGYLVAEYTKLYKTKCKTEANHAFWHGFATPVPGSWNGQRLERNQAGCQKLLREKAAPNAILRFECDVCKNERRSKARVADGSAEAPAKLASAKAIFTTNAVINCEPKLGPQKQDRCCTMPLQKTGYQAWLCVKSQIWAKKN